MTVPAEKGSANDNERTLANEMAELRRDHDLLANQYVVLEQLHRSLKLPDVVGAIHEALVNIVGTEDFAVFVHEEASRRYELLSAMGAGQALTGFASGDGVIGRAAAAREATFGKPPAVAPINDSSGRRVGLLVILHLLRHKRAVEKRDQLLVESLARNAGVALEAALCAAAGPPAWNAVRMRALLGGRG